jgi:HSP20 family protein
MLTVARRVKPSGRLWNPAADVFRGHDSWLVKVDLAGICAEELELELDNTLLHIHGCRRDTHYREGLSYQQMEITYSRFEKTIQFPCPLDPSSLSYKYEDGFLIIDLRCV